MTILTKILKQMPFNKSPEETIAELHKAWHDFLAMIRQKEVKASVVRQDV
jgi:hypothetical protein